MVLLPYPEHVTHFDKELPMKLIHTFFSLSSLFFLSGLAHANPEQDIARVQTAMKSKVGIKNGLGDIRLLVSLSDSPLPCSDSDQIGGNSIIANFQVRRWKRSRDESGRKILVSSFETVKSYGIAASLVSQISDLELQKQIVDLDACNQ